MPPADRAAGAHIRLQAGVALDTSCVACADVYRRNEWLCGIRSIIADVVKFASAFRAMACLQVSIQSAKRKVWPGIYGKAYTTGGKLESFDSAFSGNHHSTVLLFT